MTDHLEIRGGHVATISLPPSTHLSRHTPAAAIDLYHDDASGWSVLTVPQPDTDETSPVSVVRVARYEHLAEILDDLHSRWPLQDIVAAVLDAGHRRDNPDPELLALWRVEQLDHDLYHASIYNQDLAEGGLWGPAVPAIGRQLDGWADEALTVMADHLTATGFEVVNRQPGDRTPDGPFNNPTLGTLTLVRYGHTVTATVRVDAAGELFVRADWTDRDDEDRGPGTDLAIRAKQLRKAPA